MLKVRHHRPSRKRRRSVFRGDFVHEVTGRDPYAPLGSIAPLPSMFTVVINGLFTFDCVDLSHTRLFPGHPYNIHVLNHAVTRTKDMTTVSNLERVKTSRSRDATRLALLPLMTIPTNPTRTAGILVTPRHPPAEVVAREIGTDARAGPVPVRGAVVAGIAASVVVIGAIRGRGRQSVGVGAEVVRHGVRSSRSRPWMISTNAECRETT